MDEETALSDTTKDAVLGGRVTLLQPRQGHRAGHDAVLLAAAVPAVPGDRVLDLGAGVGTAAFCLAARVAVGYLTLVEIDPGLAALAERNAGLNGVGNRTRVIVMDARARGPMRERAGLLLGAVDRVMTNPPFHDVARHRASPQAGRREAHSADEGLIGAFLRTAVAVLRPGGTLTMIHRADQPEALLSAMSGRFGGIQLTPIHPKPGAAAVRLIVTGTKGSRAPVSILPGLVLQDGEGKPTDAAEAVLRGGAALV
ncbi:methyltransferase [Phreatobacter aquaticus]|uniref:Methyltransferase n=1 Tax=Phreatobacter aquaticus TaxID=2570229 RepID=A0A4D7QP48_9HYPH|nr:methyltransferase [Phreatobacter aquaticus]QCK88251.1 methyltransferase [Phreatobacter aquaticus]